MLLINIININLYSAEYKVSQCEEIWYMSKQRIRRRISIVENI